MTRSPEFDRSIAVDKALRLFWRKGYQASSLTDLLAAMGIGRSSFYAAFTDKRSLFITCLDLFAQHTLDLLERIPNHFGALSGYAQMLAERDQPERALDLLERASAQRRPVDALQGCFEGDFPGGRGAKRQWGCLLVNTVLEMSGVDEDLAARAGRHLDRVQHVFQTSLRSAGAALPLAEDLAAMLMLVNEGVQVSSRRAPPEAEPPQSIAAIFRLVRSAIANPLVPQVSREITI